ncbi:MAG: SUF system NifU family Fe-S cluster assembly protein [Gemmatimonadaceae bacterium]|nr:SUF system NifU family Fe-S cluster assembly protein [Gemmatimonadaceae bacterium]
MSDLQELYQSIILDHNRRPKNYGSLEGATARAEGRNPLCGDEVNVELRVTDDTIEDVRFTASGCAVSRASASIMTQVVKGKSRGEVERLFTRFHDLVTGKLKPDEAESRRLGEMAAFSGVSRFPVRVKCASMPWHTLRQALRDEASIDSAPDGSAT